MHTIFAGMVLTDLLLKDSTPVARRFFNTLASLGEGAGGQHVKLAGDRLANCRFHKGSGEFGRLFRFLPRAKT